MIRSFHKSGDLVRIDLCIEPDGWWDGHPPGEHPHGTFGVVLRHAVEYPPEEEGPYYFVLMDDGEPFLWSHDTLVLIQKAEVD